MTIDDIANEVKAAGGWRTYQVGELRSALGRIRTGSVIANEIGARLRDLDCWHLPEELPNKHDAWVVVYSGAAARFIVMSVKRPDATADRDVFDLRDGKMQAAIKAVDQYSPGE